MCVRTIGLKKNKSDDLDESMLRALKAVAGEPSQSHELSLNDAAQCDSSQSHAAETSIVSQSGDIHHIAPELSRESIDALDLRGVAFFV